MRRDDQGRRLCNATTRQGNPCRGAAIKGGTVCRLHGGSAPQVRNAARRRLEEMVDPALSEMMEMLRDKDTPHSVRATLIRDVLDRAGLASPKQLEVLTEDVLDREIARLEEELSDDGL